MQAAVHTISTGSRVAAAGKLRRWAHTQVACRHRLQCKAVRAAGELGATPAPAPEPAEQQLARITYVSYEGNCFHARFNCSGAGVLVDPWLVGDLSFFEQPWLYTGEKTALGPGSSSAVDVAQVAADTDAVLITQWVDDHCHIPTLQQLPRSLHILAQPEAAQRIRPLGFKRVTTLAPGQSADVAGGRVRVTATPGALVGPPWSARQNGYIIQELPLDKQQQVDEQQPGGQAAAAAGLGAAAEAAGPSGGGVSLYYEPHCDFDAAWLRRLLAGGEGWRGSAGGLAPVDFVVSPVQSVLLGGYPLVRGATGNLEQLLQILQPKVLVPLLNADLRQQGGLVPLLSVQGPSGADALSAALRTAGLGGVRVRYPAPPGQPLPVAI